MRLVLLVAVVAWHASSAFADPAPPSARPCAVTIVAAPERVRAEIEAWVAAERRCSRTLELRITATAAGLRVHARDDRGQIRERVVPDDQSIGALIVSWIADDAPVEPGPAATAARASALAAEPGAPAPAGGSIPPGPPAPRVSEAAPRAVAEPVAAAPPLPPPTPPPAVAPRPIARPRGLDGAGVALTVPADVPRQSWLTLVAALSVSEERKYGVRGDLDLASRRWWSAGAFVAQLENSQSSMGISLTRAGGYFAAEVARGGWQLRAQAGAGGALYWLRNYCNCEQMGVGPRVRQFSLRPISELSILVGHALGARWSLAGGAMITAAIIDYDIPNQDRVSVMMFAGLRNRL